MNLYGMGCRVGVLVMVVLVPASIALAQGQDLTPITGVTQALANFLTGPMARVGGVLAVAGVGYLFFTGRIETIVALTVALGIAIVFGAKVIVDFLASAAR
jgi:type IV secretion system protein VirB2